MSKDPVVVQLQRLMRIAALPDELIDTSDIPVVEDWSRAVRGRPHEAREKSASMGRPAGGRSSERPAGIGNPSDFRAATSPASKTVQRDWYHYDFKVGGTLVHSGVTQDPARRETEHRKLWPRGRLVVIGAPITIRAAREWERELPKDAAGSASRLRRR